MPRLLVSLASLSLATLAVACSDSTSPTVTRQLEAAVSSTNSSIPFLPGAHVAVLTALDNTIWDAVAFNDLGEVVGWGNNGPATSDQTFQWTPHFGFRIRGNGVSEDSNSSEAVSVNNKAQVLFIGAYARYGIWDWQGNVQWLRPLSHNPSCVPWQINDVSVSVGSCVAGAVSLATVWTKFGTPDALWINGGSTPVQVDANFPIEISDSNYIAGPLSNNTGFVFTPTKQLRVLPFPTIAGFNVTAVFPVAVNNHGQAVGYAYSLGGGAICFTRAVAWLSPGQATDLGFCGEAVGITDDGTILATREDSATGMKAAVLRTNAGVLYRLPGLEGGAALNKESSAVTSVNHTGKALGGILTSTNASHAVVWTLPAL